MVQHSSATIAATTVGFETKTLSQAALDYATQVRGISRETLAHLGAASGTQFFPRRLQRRSEAVFFPYHMDGKLANWKACAFPEKDFIGLKGGKLCFLNIDRILSASPGDIWFVEGEWDAAAMIEAGLPADRVTSVPNGGREHKTDEQKNAAEPSGYGYVEEALKRGLGKHKRLIWCGDADEAGYSLRADMAKILGAAKFWFVEWPDGIKDANDMLRKDGAQALRELVTDGMMPWPVSGLYSLSDLPELPPIKPWYVPNLSSWENKIRFAPGTMSVVTGHPGHGKTQLMAQVWHDVAKSYGLIVAAATFETRAKPHYRRILRTLNSGKLERDMSAQDIAAADGWINEHYRFMVHPDQQPNLAWLLDTAEVAVVRHGAKVVQIDPWNRLESQRDNRESETEYIGRCLTNLYVFAQDMGCHVQVLAHPSKMEGPRKGRPPELDDIAGSKHWDNRVDQGLVVHRPKLFDGAERCTSSVVYHKKTRFEELGHPCKLGLNLNIMVGRFEESNKGESHE
jgi:twinkle protein